MAEYQLPYTFKKLSDEEQELAQIGWGHELIRLSPTKYTVPECYKKYGSELYNFKPRSDDIWLVGYPRSGTTLTQEILYLLGTNLDYEKASSKIMDERFPFLEHILMRSEEDNILYELCKNKSTPLTPKENAAIPFHVKLAQTKEKRFIKSHVGFDLLNPELLNTGCKVVFIARNVKDCIVSDYFYPINIEAKKTNDINKLCQAYIKNMSVMGNYFEMLKEAWKMRNNENLLFLIYEEVTKNKREAILKISKFLNKSITEEQLNTLMDHTDIKNFKKNKSLNNDHLFKNGDKEEETSFSFIRHGKTGSWRELFSEESNRAVNEWIKDNIKEIKDFEMPKRWKEIMDL